MPHHWEELTLQSYTDESLMDETQYSGDLLLRCVYGREANIMTKLNLTKNEEIVLQACLDRAFEPNMITFGDMRSSDLVKDYEINSLKGIFGSLANKQIFMFDICNDGEEYFAFQLPVRTDDEPKNGYIDTVEKVKRWFEEDKDKLGWHEWYEYEWN